MKCICGNREFMYELSGSQWKIYCPKCVLSKSAHTKACAKELLMQQLKDHWDNQPVTRNMFLPFNSLPPTGTLCKVVGWRRGVSLRFNGVNLRGEAVLETPRGKQFIVSFDKIVSAKRKRI